jgi:hypothetical protein
MPIVSACGTTGDQENADGNADAPCSGSPCNQPAAASIDAVTIDGSGGSTTVSFSATVENPSSYPLRIGGWVFECRYISPDASMLRGSGTSSITIAPCSSATLSDPGFVPTPLHWEGTPTGDGLRCIIDLVYMYEGCDGSGPAVRSTVTGSDTITVIAP